jgi:hypothetical protein
MRKQLTYDVKRAVFDEIMLIYYASTNPRQTKDRVLGNTKKQVNQESLLLSALCKARSFESWGQTRKHQRDTCMHACLGRIHLRSPVRFPEQIFLPIH